MKTLDELIGTKPPSGTQDKTLDELIALSPAKPTRREQNRQAMASILAKLPVAKMPEAEYGGYVPIGPAGQSVTESLAGGAVTPLKTATSMARGIGQLATAAPAAAVQAWQELSKRPSPAVLRHIEQQRGKAVSPDKVVPPPPSWLNFIEDVRAGAFGEEPTAMEQWAESVQQRPIIGQEKAGVSSLPTRAAYGGIDLGTRMLAMQMAGAKVIPGLAGKGATTVAGRIGAIEMNAGRIAALVFATTTGDIAERTKAAAKAFVFASTPSGTGFVPSAPGAFLADVSANTVADLVIEGKYDPADPNTWVRIGANIVTAAGTRPHKTLVSRGAKLAAEAIRLAATEVPPGRAGKPQAAIPRQEGARVPPPTPKAAVAAPRAALGKPVQRTIFPERVGERGELRIPTGQEVKLAGQKIGESAQKAHRGVSALMGDAANLTLPRTTIANREAGEAGAEYAASRAAAPYLAERFSDRILVESGVDPMKLGAVLTEANLRGVARQRIEAGEENVQVHTLVGQPNSPFKTEADYQATLKDPVMRKGIDAYKRIYAPEMDRLYKLAQDIAPEANLPTRGEAIDARINLFAVPIGETVPKQGAVQIGVGEGRLGRAFRKRSPFARKATGEAPAYNIDLRAIIENSLGRQLEAANHKLYADALIKHGDATLAMPGKQIELKGEKAVPFPYKRASAKAGLPPHELYVRKTLAGEYRAALGTDVAYIPGVTPIADVINKAALVGPADNIYHSFNVVSRLMTRPGMGGGPIREAIAATGGPQQLAVTLGNLMNKVLRLHAGDAKAKNQLAELAKIGALRSFEKGGTWYRPHTWLQWITRGLDKSGRLMADDAYQMMKNRGWAKDTPTARREFVNQLGNYNMRTQNALTRWLRQTKLAPFATAGQTMFGGAVRDITMSPGVKATGVKGVMAMRGLVLSRWVGTFTFVGLMNYLLTRKDEKGGIFGRPGTPIGAIDLGGPVNEKGEHRTLPVTAILGYERSLRVTGAKAVIEGTRSQMTKQEMLDAAANAIMSALGHPFVGPSIRAAYQVRAGASLLYPNWKTAEAALPGKSQLAQNIKGAVSDIIQFSPKNLERTLLGPAYPKAVSQQRAERLPESRHAAKLYAYLDDLFMRAGREPVETRVEFISKAIGKLSPEDQEVALTELRWRRRHLFSGYMPSPGQKQPQKEKSLDELINMSD